MCSSNNDHKLAVKGRPSGSRAIFAAVTLGGADLMLRGFLVLTRHVSEQRLLRLAPVIGRMMRCPWKNRTIGNMKLFLEPAEWSEAHWDQLWKAHTRHVGQTIVEFIVWHRLSEEELLTRVSIRGEHHLHGTLRAGRGAMVLTSHLGNFLALAPCLRKLGVPAHITGQQMPTPFVATFLQEFVRRYGTRYLSVGQGHLPLAAAKSFRQGTAFAGFVDISAVGKRDVWLRFGRAETNVSIGPVLLARRHRVPVLCVSCRRLDATRHEVTFHPPLTMPVSADGRADARHLTAQALKLIAGQIENDVDQWWQWDRIPLRPLPAEEHPRASTNGCRTLVDEGKIGRIDQERSVIW
jgi:Kdo2-lipid IVA lauroyltransferase/acyltransferase